MKKMLLEDYRPQLECVRAETKITKAKFPVIDIHTHMGKLVMGKKYKDLYDTKSHITKLNDLNVEHVVNLDGCYGKDFDNMMKKVSDYRDSISTFIWIDFSKFGTPEFEKETTEHILSSFHKGAKGIKMWKVISLEYKDEKGNYIRTDDPRMKFIYKLAAKLNLPILIHIADPTAFFKPVDENNERYEELKQNPSWSFCKEGLMSFEELLVMQENMIRNNKKTKFIIAHFGSYAENLDYVGKQLDKYPNMYIDTAARFSELGRVPYSARKFFIKYQDRILFGTDSTPLSYSEYLIAFRFLETFDECFYHHDEKDYPGQGRWYIYGISLPNKVLKKIYSQNAIKLLKLDLKNVV
ncbi:amidohydrolase family protein [Anaerorhabdus sp.]|uniref:amidohydrolase family protein n=1 Tax=Anaerorhabdus sp. TaxID=1872524 RepID=UPI002B20394E|nr:amidohydrolase family protein [Anaerorhabdus sp.]MEA4876249.1 amidohydrolase family protein [Anaerorhabdus sp.]